MEMMCWSLTSNVPTSATLRRVFWGRSARSCGLPTNSATRRRSRPNATGFPPARMESVRVMLIFITLRSAASVGSWCSSSGCMGGNWRDKPLSTSIELVTRNRMSSMNEMSAVDVVFSCGTRRLLFLNMFLSDVFHVAVDHSARGDDNQNEGTAHEHVCQLEPAPRFEPFPVDENGL